MLNVNKNLLFFRLLYKIIHLQVDIYYFKNMKNTSNSNL